MKTKVLTEKTATILIPILFFIIGTLISLNQISQHSQNLHLKVLIKSSNFWNTFWTILINNFKICILIIISGVGFYILATGIVGVNMILFGSSVAINLYKNGWSDTFLRYLHALIEIPAIIVSLFISYRLSTFIIKSLQDKRDINLKKNLIGLSKYILLSFLLLIIAAIIESIVINHLI